MKILNGIEDNMLGVCKVMTAMGYKMDTVFVTMSLVDNNGFRLKNLSIAKFFNLKMHFKIWKL